MKIKGKINKKINLCIMYGGPGGEHEVSCRSAENIINNVDLQKYNLKTILLSKNQNGIGEKDLKLLRQEKYIVWPIFHGEFGEGGKLQAILEKNKIKFIGCKSKSAKLAIDKIKTQKVLEKNGILVPKSYIVSDGYSPAVQGNFPIILKPVNGGSSIDLYKVLKPEDLANSLKKIFENHKEIILQEFVVGREFTCGVLQMGKKNIALPASEIVLTKTETFNYEAKYSVGGCLEVTPAKVDVKLMKRIQETALKVHKLIGCKDISRTDMILNKENKLVVLEINTMPGMTKTSFIPQQLSHFNDTEDSILEELKSAGISISKFIDILVENNRK